jgi:hypothetical protein
LSQFIGKWLKSLNPASTYTVVLNLVTLIKASPVPTAKATLLTVFQDLHQVNLEGVSKISTLALFPVHLV